MLVKLGSVIVVSVVCDIPGGVSAPSVAMYSINGGSFTSSGITSLTYQQTSGSSIYFASVQLDTTSVGTTGDLVFVVEDTAGTTIGAKQIQIVGFDPNDATALGLSNLNASISSRGTCNPGDAMTLTGGELAAIAAAAATAVLTTADNVDAGCTVKDALAVMVAVLTGKEDTVAGTTTFQNWALTHYRVTTQATAGGNRIAPTVDLT